MNKSFFAKIKEKYFKKYSMTQECHRVSVRKNLKHFLITCPILAIFGTVMLIIVIFLGIKEQNFTECFYQCIYYGGFAVFGIIGYIWSKIVYKKPYVDYALKQAFPFWITTICFQMLCLFNVQISQRAMIGVLAWITMLLILVLYFDINPFLFIIDMFFQILILSFCVVNVFRIEYMNFLLLIILSIFFCFMHWKQVINDFNKENALEIADLRNSNLLLNILPQGIVDEMNNGIRSIPKIYEDVSILFLDIVNYSEISQKVSPKILIEEINNLFLNFDLIMDKYNSYRVKTMGYSYLAVCGLPKKDSDNAKKIISAGLECLDYVKRRNKVAPLIWEIRVGANSGNVIGGIVGARKYSYDLFGDVVKFTCQLGRKAESMKLIVSEITYEKTKDFFNYTEYFSISEEGKDNLKMYYAEEDVNILEDVENLENI